ncbi:long chain acyl-CoA synthetase 1 [Pyrus ussuriensis x Pyrus communis]|uniref:Long chain acyl-CoA synthetase 1 n=1 Tax=Pyrus ussuriensis x Pyrus communis TaxID=2448454 RepID=A0A5N5HC63_9ROSA|nr:long chain acyl-CoA synthetase 1 [Pyrus ussuriensis x Pyrus communis]
MEAAAGVCFGRHGVGESAMEIREKANRQRIAATELGRALAERKRMRRRLLPQLQQTPTTTPSRSWLPEIQGCCMHLVSKIGCRRSLSRRQNKTQSRRTCNFRVFRWTWWVGVQDKEEEGVGRGMMEIERGSRRRRFTIFNF